MDRRRLQEIERYCRKWIINQNISDAAHDLAHIERVVKSARLIAESESADPEIVIPAAWLHDCVVLPKNHPERKKASTLAARKAVKILAETGFPENKRAAVGHAVEAHSFSAGIPTRTIEAKIVQDADRLDALGAIGIARCFSISGQMGSSFYHPEDPFAEKREYDDRRWAVDHFYKKLLLLPDTMHTKSARNLAEKRVQFMKAYLQELAQEVGAHNPG